MIYRIYYKGKRKFALPIERESQQSEKGAEG